ncbi:cysteine-rich receptor-like protein kinase 43 [Impatiens glandulifera]|uniref:cysteine-rich receptor-like protein kinase 43 n=1 Tax=Impatiens glandulifera TaxID=253017 RepID=UPI001FB09EFF|nr:cysteine-rich receptor-like protein kinase 43 [Impatiens glandulifera]
MGKTGDLIRNLAKALKFISTHEDGKEEDDELERFASQENKQFSFETLVSATRNFHSDHKLGQGGFGPVYKGKLNDGRDIAVKRLAITSTQGGAEFMNEAKLLSRIQHRNVVNLLGYCLHDSEKLLVYEYVANESLDKFLFNPAKQNVLDWRRRYNIISAVAKGLHYLHVDAHESIIHRDIKASNILLDDKWVPKISDFGMARLFPGDQTHVNTRVAGTDGYMAPEYLMHGRLTVKADVFSFGVVVLELISGRKNTSFEHNLEFQNLLEWVYKMYKKGKTMEIMDTTLAKTAIADQVVHCILIGLLCVQADLIKRPTMHQVVLMLSKKAGTIEQEPMRPGYPGRRYRVSSQMSNIRSSTSSSTTNSNSNSSFASVASIVSDFTSSSVELDDPRGKRPMDC